MKSVMNVSLRILIPTFDDAICACVCVSVYVCVWIFNKEISEEINFDEDDDDNNANVACSTKQDIYFIYIKWLHSEHKNQKLY